MKAFKFSGLLIISMVLFFLSSYAKPSSLQQAGISEEQKAVKKQILAEKNKKILRQIKAGEVDWFAQWADDAVWIIPGTTKWSGVYRGKREIVEKLLRPITAEMKTPGWVTWDNIIAEGDYVVIQAHAEGRITKTGKPYNNTYCLVYKIVDGKIRELTEYCDTELITAVFGK